MSYVRQYFLCCCQTTGSIYKIIVKTYKRINNYFYIRPLNTIGMEKVFLINSEGRERETTLVAWEYKPEQARLKENGWKLKPQEQPQPEAENESQTKTKKK